MINFIPPPSISLGLLILSPIDGIILSQTFIVVINIIPLLTKKLNNFCLVLLKKRFRRFPAFRVLTNPLIFSSVISILGWEHNNFPRL